MNLIRRAVGLLSEHKGLYALGLVFLLTVEGAATYQTLTSTTGVSTPDAITQFRQDQKAAEKTGGGFPSPLSTSPAPAVSLASKATATGGGQSPIPQNCESPCMTVYRAPAPGVYEMYQCGKSSGQCTGASSEPEATESFGPVPRSFKRIGTRSTVVSGPQNWKNVYKFIDEHEEELYLSMDSTGSFTHRRWARFDFGGQTVISDVVQDPPARAMKFPIVQGDSWSGSWKDRNGESDGNHANQWIEKQELTIGGQKVRAWVLNMKFTLTGPKNSGTVNIWLWLAPEVEQVVQERYVQDITNDQGLTYRSNYMITMTSLKPKT